jgi:DNA-binding MarR family transcriptional regulator
VRSAVNEGRDETEMGNTHEQLLLEAVQRSSVLPRIMRLVVQHVRSEFPGTSDSPESGASPGDRQTPPAIGEAQYHVLYVLATAGSQTVGELADRCHVADPTVSKILNHLEANDLIERHVDRANRRVVRVVLTDAGRAAHEHMKLRFEAALARVLAPLTDAELANLVLAFGHLESLVDETESHL